LLRADSLPFTVLTANNMMALSTKARVFAGLTQFPGKLLSLFEPHTEIIRKGKAGAARSRKDD